MKKYFIIIYLFFSNAFIFSQFYLDKTPARYFNTLTNNDFQNEGFISSNKIKKIYFIETIKKDTSYVRTFDNKGRKIEEINFENGKRNEKWIYEYKENNKSILMYRFEDNEIINEKPEIWFFEYDKNNNLIFQKNNYRSGNEMTFKYLYDKNNNLICRENYVKNTLTNSYNYKYQNNLLIEYTSKRHFSQNGETKTLESETVNYLYDENNRLIQINSQRGNAKGVYNFKYNNDKLSEEEYDSYDNYKGDIIYNYNNNLLTNIIEKVESRGLGEIRIFHDNKSRICKIETYNDGGLIFRNFFARKDKTKTIQEYFFDKYDFWIKMEKKQDDVLIYRYEYKIEYY